MRWKMGWRKTAGVIAGLALSGTLLGWAQYVSRPGGQLPREANSDETYNSNPVLNAKRVKALNADRHKTVVSDTEKLVKLARQLDAEIASNPTDELTPEEMHKLETIEKLAHNVKAKMAESFGGGPEVRPLFLTPRGVVE
jgi:hypothetical protein